MFAFNITDKLCGMHCFMPVDGGSQDPSGADPRRESGQQSQAGPDQTGRASHQVRAEGEEGGKEEG